MKILVTGGLGYIGGRTAQFLLKLGHQVYLGTRSVRDPPPWAPNALVAKMNWLDSSSLQNACSKVDMVIHAAGMNAHDCSIDPIAALEFNGLATARLVDSAYSAGVRRFLYLSSAHVYDASLRGAITEKTRPLNMHPYSTSHLAGESFVIAHKNNSSMVGAVLRLSNAFGAPVNKDVNCWMLLVNDLCRQAVITNSIRLRSAGMQRRDFITMADVCRAIYHLMNLNNKEIGDGIFNVGSGWTPKVIEIAEIIQSRCLEILKYKPNILISKEIEVEISQVFSYEINKLINTDFFLLNNTIEEIDQTLIFCKNNFKSNK